MATDREHGGGNGDSRGLASAVEMAASTREAGIAAGQETQARRYPTGEITTMAEARPRQANTPAMDTGGTMLRISLRDVVYFLGAIMTIAAIVWTLRSDIRDLKTTMDLQNKLTEERWQRQAEDMKKFTGVQTMQGYDIQDLKLALASAGLYNPKKPVTITNVPQPENQR